jgi:hypothetical protein
MPKAGADAAASRKDTTDAKNKHPHKNGEKRSLNHLHSSYDAREWDFDANEKRIFETDVLEVWFSGCHTGAFSLFHMPSLLSFLFLFLCVNTY